MSHRAIVAKWTFLAALCSQCLADEHTYSVVRALSLQYAVDINNWGQVLGYDATNVLIYDMHTGSTQTIFPLRPPPPGVWVWPNAFNDSGVIIGGGQGGFGRPFVYDGSMTVLPYTGSFSSINASGDAVGGGFFADNNYSFELPVLHSNGVSSVISNSWSSAHAFDINNSGTIVGRGWPPNAANRGFVYSGGGLVDLGTFGGDWSEGSAVNDGGIVVGWAQVTGGNRHAFWYNGVKHDLETAVYRTEVVDGVPHEVLAFQGAVSAAKDINNRGEIVGSVCETPGSNCRPFVYDGVMRDLNSVIDATTGVIIEEAIKINNLGQILTRGRVPNATGYSEGIIVLTLIEPPSTPGDYNQNGIVDAADYVVWRKTLDQTGTGLAADGNGNYRIDIGDFDVWRENFGQIANSGAGAAAAEHTSVPEPLSAAILAAGIALIASFLRRRIADVV